MKIEYIKGYYIHDTYYSNRYEVNNIEPLIIKQLNYYTKLYPWYFEYYRFMEIEEISNIILTILINKNRKKIK